MTGARDFSGLLKSAFFSPAGRNGTVGDFMRAWSSDLSADVSLRRDAFDRINRAGIDVNQPASRLLSVLGGGVLARVAAKYLGFGPFWTNAATIGGALYGNSLYGRRHPAPGRPMRYVPGMSRAF